LANSLGSHHELDGLPVGAIWQIQLNDPCSVTVYVAVATITVTLFFEYFVICM